MARSGRLQSKVERLKKKITAKGASLAADKKRVLKKQLKRFQRARRTALTLEKRAAGGAATAKAPAEKPAGEAAATPKPSEEAQA